MRRLIDTIEIRHPRLPASMDGFRVLHVSDLHFRDRGRDERTVSRLLKDADDHMFDLVCVTGDTADGPRHAGPAARLLARLVEGLRGRTRCGLHGVMGNHDRGAVRDALASVDGIVWHDAGTTVLDAGGATIDLVATSDSEDLLEASLAEHRDASRFTIALTHFPTQIYPAFRYGIDLLLAGHTHGGQIRVSPTRVPHTSCDLTGDVASGCLRLENTLCCISRGLGTAVVPIRLRCPPHAPLYVLRRGDLPGLGCDPPELHIAIPW